MLGGSLAIQGRRRASRAGGHCHADDLEGRKRGKEGKGEGGGRDKRERVACEKIDFRRYQGRADTTALRTNAAYPFVHPY